MNFLIKMFEILTKKQKRKLFLLQILSLFVSLIEVLGIASIAPFIAVASNSSIIHTNHVFSILYVQGRFTSDVDFVKMLGLATLLIIFLGGIFNFLLNWFLTSFGVEIGNAISVNLYRSYLDKDYLFHTQSNTAVLVKNIFHEVVRVTNNLIIQSLVLVAKLITIVFIVGTILLINPIAAISIGSILGIFYFTIYSFTKKKLHATGVEMSVQAGHYFQIANEGLGGIKDVKLNAKEAVYAKLLERMMGEYGRLSIYGSVMPLAPRYGLELLILGSAILTLVYLLQQGQNILGLLPAISLFAMAGLKCMSALQQVFTSITTIKSNIFCFDLISNDLSTLDTHRDISPIPFKSNELFQNFKSINLEKVSFKYPGASHDVLDNINVSIKRNTTTAFVGPSGSGKSTLVDLLSGLLSPRSGSIKIDKTILNSSNVREWQSEISYVSQSVYLTDGSFKENIAFGENEASINLDRVIEVAKLARIHDFIQSRPEGYDSRVGERGVQISGGQRQRLGIARALYRNPLVLILDEATSALDKVTENEIMDSIESLTGNKTIIIISHRLNTIKKSHSIYLLNKGRLEAQGTYQDLLSSNNHFQELSKD